MDEIKEYKKYYKIITKPKLVGKDRSFQLKIINNVLRLIVSEDIVLNAFNGLSWIIPADVDKEKIYAEFENNTLNIKLFKLNYERNVDIKRK